MYNKYILFIFGIACLVNGIDTIINPIWQSSKFQYTIDMTPIKWFYGVFSIMLGIISIYSQYSKSKNKTPEYSICPKCKESYIYYKLKDGLCPKCNIKTENLDGYYDKKKDDEPKI